MGTILILTSRGVFRIDGENPGELRYSRIGAEEGYIDTAYTQKCGATEIGMFFKNHRGIWIASPSEAGVTTDQVVGAAGLQALFFGPTDTTSTLGDIYIQEYLGKVYFLAEKYAAGVIDGYVCVVYDTKQEPPCWYRMSVSGGIPHYNRDDGLLYLCNQYTRVRYIFRQGTGWRSMVWQTGDLLRELDTDKLFVKSESKASANIGLQVYVDGSSVGSKTTTYNTKRGRTLLLPQGTAGRAAQVKLSAAADTTINEVTLEYEEI